MNSPVPGLPGRLMPAGLLLYLLLLALWDWKTRTLPGPLLLAGGVCGLFLRALSCGSGTELLSYGAGMIFGLGMLLLTKLSAGALGAGDGLCFISLAFWLEPGALFILLCGSAAAAAVLGLLFSLLKKRKNPTLPFLPFVAGTALLMELSAVFPAALL